MRISKVLELVTALICPLFLRVCYFYLLVSLSNILNCHTFKGVIWISLCRDFVLHSVDQT